MTEPLKLAPLPKGEWDETLLHIVDDMRGRPLNVHGLMAHHPSLLEAWWPFRNHSVRENTLDERHRELAILRIAWNLGAWYEWASHVERGMAAGLAVDEIERVKTGADHGDWSENDATLLCAADECFFRHGINVVTRARLEEFLDTAQIMDLVATCGLYLMLGCLIHTWSLELDDFVDLPDGITEANWRERRGP